MRHLQGRKDPLTGGEGHAGLRCGIQEALFDGLLERPQPGTALGQGQAGIQCVEDGG